MRSISMYLIAVYLIAAVCGRPNQEYIVNKTIGVGYRLNYHAQPWEKAREVCSEDGAKLAVPKSKEEFSFLQKVVRGMSYHDVVGSNYKLLVWLGVSNLDDYTMWKTIDYHQWSSTWYSHRGENIEDTGFSRWAGHNGQSYSDAPSQPHCVGLTTLASGTTGAHIASPLSAR